MFCTQVDNKATNDLLGVGCPSGWQVRPRLPQPSPFSLTEVSLVGNKLLSSDLDAKTEALGFPPGQQDAHEALMQVCDLWCKSEHDVPKLTARNNLIAPCLAQCFKMLGIVRETAAGCVACRFVGKKAEEQLFLQILPPPLTAVKENRHTSHAVQIENWGAPENVP